MAVAPIATCRRSLHSPVGRLFRASVQHQREREKGAIAASLALLLVAVDPRVSFSGSTLQLWKSCNRSSFLETSSSWSPSVALENASSKPTEEEKLCVPSFFICAFPLAGDAEVIDFSFSSSLQASSRSVAYSPSNVASSESARYCCRTVLVPAPTHVRFIKNSSPAFSASRPLECLCMSRHQFLVHQNTVVMVSIKPALTTSVCKRRNAAQLASFKLPRTCLHVIKEIGNSLRVPGAVLTNVVLIFGPRASLTLDGSTFSYETKKHGKHTWCCCLIGWYN
ncbi:uncharacterized protein LOC116260296 [Nymphaea colorata]|nr:uncharacterized protein LOC116260296 [Nymphaea colorata]